MSIRKTDTIYQHSASRKIQKTHRPIEEGVGISEKEIVLISLNLSLEADKRVQQGGWGGGK